MTLEFLALELLEISLGENTSVNSTIKEDFLDVLISYFKNKAGHYD